MGEKKMQHELIGLALKILCDLYQFGILDKGGKNRLYDNFFIECFGTHTTDNVQPIQ